MMGKEALSSAFSEMILEEAKKDKNIMVVCTDSRGSAKLGAYPDELPEQFVEWKLSEKLFPERQKLKETKNLKMYLKR